MAQIKNDSRHLYERIAAIEITLGYLREDMIEVKGDIKSVKERSSVKFVTNEELDKRINDELALMRKIVYGAAGMVLIAFIGSLIARSFVQ